MEAGDLDGGTAPGRAPDGSGAGDVWLDGADDLEAARDDW
jgi:hypothetical protein